MQTYHEPGDFLEVVVDVATGRGLDAMQDQSVVMSQLSALNRSAAVVNPIEKPSSVHWASLLAVLYIRAVVRLKTLAISALP
eukprot:2777841-Amphidinium_carterae.1